MTSSYDAAVIDDLILKHPDLIRAGRSAQFLQLEAIVWSKQHRTDGFIPTHMPPLFSGSPTLADDIGSLVEVGRWAEVPDGGWQIVGFLDSQMSAARIAQKRELGSIRYDNWQAREAAKHAPNALGKSTNAFISNSNATAPPRPATQGKGEGVGARADTLPRASAGSAAPPMDGDDEDDSDSSSRCDRCGVVVLDDEGKVLGDDLYCPTCRDYRRADGNACTALTKATGEPCSQRVKEGHWCQYHRQPRSRGSDPSIGQPQLDRERRKAQAKAETEARKASEARTAALALETMTPAQRREAVKQEWERSQYEYDEEYHGDELDRAAGIVVPAEE
jgi:hypothetical protein